MMSLQQATLVLLNGDCDSGDRADDVVVPEAVTEYAI